MAPKENVDYKIWRGWKDCLPRDAFRFRQLQDWNGSGLRATNHYLYDDPAVEPLRVEVSAATFHEVADVMLNVYDGTSGIIWHKDNRDGPVSVLSLGAPAFFGLTTETIYEGTYCLPDPCNVAVIPLYHGDLICWNDAWLCHTVLSNGPRQSLVFR